MRLWLPDEMAIAVTFPRFLATMLKSVPSSSEDFITPASAQ